MLTDVCISKQCFLDALVYEPADDSDLIEGFIMNSVIFGMIIVMFRVAHGGRLVKEDWKVEKPAMERRVSFRSLSPQPTSGFAFRSSLSPSV